MSEISEPRKDVTCLMIGSLWTLLKVNKRSSRRAGSRNSARIMTQAEMLGAWSGMGVMEEMIRL